MKVSRHILVCLFLLLLGFSSSVFAQLGFKPDIPKPKPYENRVLKAEKTQDKKLGAYKKFFQGLSTHYNYYFNASNKLNEVIERAKTAHKDDYTDLLPFYNYSLDATANEKTQLDSVIYKAQTGIVMHDLRNDWADNLYMLWGAAYYLEKKFDSSSLMFQFINYAFADKEKDGYYKYIGSRMDGNEALSISTKEKNSFSKRVLSRPPSRNDAFIWQIRSMISQDRLTQAGSLIATLKNDPNFPQRLYPELEEVQAWWYYRQNMWDSSADHLVHALDVATNKQERARWEYLAAQMYERSHQEEEAQKWYAHAIDHTVDPVMEIYARLNSVRLNKSGGEDYIDKNIAELLKMARKDKYEDYRDVIYFMAAQMEMERNNVDAARELMMKGAKYNNGDQTSHNNAFLLIADLSYSQKKYLQAAAYYDSVKTNQLSGEIQKKVEERKSTLSKLVSYDKTISNQDSLQRIAALPEQERNALIQRLVKQLRKSQGLKEENSLTSGNAALASAKPVDLFESQQSKGEWYFYNTTLKTQGVVQFKQIWGNRPNVDNWRRFTDVNQQLLARVPNKTRDADKITDISQVDNTPTFNSLLSQLPLTDEQLKKSNDSIKMALFNLGNLYMNSMEDYPSAIETFEKLRTRFPDFNNMNEVLFHLYYAYTKTGNTTQAEQARKLLQDKYPDSRYSTIIATGKDPLAVSKKSPESTKEYEAIYDLFIEGKFEEAEAAKKRADSIYKTNYWQPQLLYIEAVYHIKQRDDSVAKNILQTLIRQSESSPMGEKAKNLLGVLNRRSQIEEELNNLQLERPQEDSVTTAPPAIVQKQVTPPPVQQTVTQAPPPPEEESMPATQLKRENHINAPRNETGTVSVTRRPPGDTLSRRPALIRQKTASSVYTFDPASKHYAMIILDKVDPIFVNEAKNAFTRFSQESFYNLSLQVTSTDLDADRKMLLIGDFPNAQEAIDYAMKAKRLAPTEIVPWLKADKYSFFIMTDANLEVLRNSKDLTLYKKFLEQNLPVKF